MNNPEAIIQAAIVKELRSLGVFVFMVPNDLAKSNPVATGQAITMGLWPGMSDLVLIRKSDGVAHFLEVKSMRGKLSERQAHFADICDKHGWPFAMVKSVDEAKIVAKQWQMY